jgi:hypothetical protein
VPGTFARYYLEQPVLTPLTFYVGWQQVDETFLNVGYDRNSPNNQNILYNIDGSWTPSSLRQKGAIMIRPVFGKRTDVGIKAKRQQSIITCFPNPATDWITVMFPENISSKQGKLTVYSLSGEACINRKVYSGERVSIGELREGLYLVELKLFGGEVFYTKLIKTQ